jgi:type II secretory pathway pseudopilin PulG
MKRRGFTIIELLVIIALILLLLAFLLPAVARLRLAAASSSSQNNLRQMAIAVHNYHDSFGKMPPGLGVGKVNNAEGPLHFHILPFIEQDNVFKKALSVDGKGGPWNNGVYGTVVAVYLDPNDKSAPPGNRYEGWLATTNYAGNWLVFHKGDKSFANIPDGTSNTFMFATRYQMCNGQPTAWGYPEAYYWAPLFAYYSTARFQMNPTPEACDPALAQSIAGAMHIAMCDGSSRELNASLSPRTWRLLCEPADGMVLDNDF